MPKTTPTVEETAKNQTWSQEAFEAAGYTEILPRTDYSIHDAAAVELIAEARTDATASAHVVGSTE